MNKHCGLPVIYLGNSVCQFVQEVKYLGVIIHVVLLKTALYVQIDNVKPAYIFVILLTITLNIILDVPFAITNYQLLYVY